MLELLIRRTILSLLIIGSIKLKVVDEYVLDGHTLKKQRNSLMDSGLSNTVRMMWEWLAEKNN